MDYITSKSQHGVDDERPRKRVRKGTKSCWECKRRKVKCQLSSEDVPVCSGCLARGTTCLSQEFPEERDSSSGLQVGERLGRVERLLETLVAKVTAYEEEEHAQKILTPESTNELDDAPSDMHAGSDGSPFLTLFDNAVIGHPTQAATPATTTGMRTPSARTACGRPTKTERIRQALLQLMPSQSDMDVIYNTNCCSILLNSVSWSSLKSNVQKNPSPFDIAEVEKQGPVAIARTLLYVAVCIQQLEPTFDKSRLNIQPSLKVRTERILSTVNALVTSDDDLVTCLEGIECLILQGMLAINDGSPRRAWLIYRRALNLGQLMGLAKTAAEPTLRGRPMWHQMVQGDRYLSLLLGLPAGTSEDIYEPEENFRNPDVHKEHLFGRKLGDISLKLIQRNQSGTMPAYAGTQEIDDMLDSLAREMPSSWWEVPDINDENANTQSVCDDFDRLMTQIWFYQIQGLVHLPFMLRASTERRFEYSKFSCLKACREVLWRYIAMRKSFNKTFCCKIMDFGALTATVALFLGVIDPQNAAVDQSMTQQQGADRALINMVLHTMEDFSQNGNEIVAAQSASVIKSLLATDHPTNPTRGNLRLTIPYFGTLTIVRPPVATPALTPVSQMDEHPAARHPQQHNATPPFQNQSPAPNQQTLSVGQDVTADTTQQQQPWQAMQVLGQNSMSSFPTVSFQSSYFNQMPSQQPGLQNLGWEDADTLFFDGLLNADIEGNWTF